MDRCEFYHRVYDKLKANFVAKNDPLNQTMIGPLTLPELNSIDIHSDNIYCNKIVYAERICTRESNPNDLSPEIEVIDTNLKKPAMFIDGVCGFQPDHWITNTSDNAQYVECHAPIISSHTSIHGLFRYQNQYPDDRIDIPWRTPISGGFPPGQFNRAISLIGTNQYQWGMDIWCDGMLGTGISTYPCGVTEYNFYPPADPGEYYRVHPFPSDVRGAAATHLQSQQTLYNNGVYRGSAASVFSLFIDVSNRDHIHGSVTNSFQGHIDGMGGTNSGIMMVYFNHHLNSKNTAMGLGGYADTVPKEMLSTLNSEPIPCPQGLTTVRSLVRDGTQYYLEYKTFIPYANDPSNEEHIVSKHRFALSPTLSFKLLNKEIEMNSNTNSSESGL